MSDETGMTTSTPTAGSRSAAAERMRAHRERRRAGLRCLTVQLFETEIDELIRKGFLKEVARNDRHAVYGFVCAFRSYFRGRVMTRNGLRAEWTVEKLAADYDYIEARTLRRRGMLTDS
jgi:hypothetical protein